ncbi:MAG: hypothetical protein FWG87_09555 [Defluviitaleaceae bacterium]|nr:hypothetical protein [Defluviitaleaceae bacterium]
MTHLNEWKLAESLKESGRRDVVVGLCIAVLLITTLAVFLAIKIDWLKQRGFFCDCDGYDDDYYMDTDELDENGCAYTSERDFV